MKGFLIGPDNQKFEAEIVRYFQNVNDHYLIYTKNEKDANGYVLLYATKVVSDNGIKVGENITDENEWALIKSFLQKTVSENKEGRPVSIDDSNPVEVNDLKINAQRPFKLSETSVELFSKNKKSFEIVQKMAEEQNTVKVPVAPEVSEFVVNEPAVETPVEQSEQTNEVQSDSIDTSAFNFELPTMSETPAAPEVNVAEPTVETPVEQPVQAEEAKVEENIVNEPIIEANEVATPEVNPQETTETQNYEELYKNEVEKNEALTKEIEQLLKDNASYKEKIDKLKELLG